MDAHVLVALSSVILAIERMEIEHENDHSTNIEGLRNSLREIGLTLRVVDRILR